MKIAVVGSGASAISAVSALLTSGSETEITVFDIGSEINTPVEIHRPHSDGLGHVYDHIYREIARQNQRSFPPKKTHFGTSLKRTEGLKDDSVYWNGYLGGLTNFWGASMLPFTDRELRDWPINRSQLDPYYRNIAELVGIAGQKDSLNDYIGEDYANRPSMASLAVLSRIEEQSAGQHNDNPSFFFGVNRCALETRLGQDKMCVYCGECLAGCVKGSLFNAGNLFRRYIREGLITYVKCRVHRFDNITRELYVEQNDEWVSYSGFEKLFLCAGCFGTTELLMRSYGISAGVSISDNAVITFPMVNVGSSDEEFNGTYFGLTNNIGLLVPKSSSKPVSQLQIYPNADYLWRFNVRSSAWKILSPLVSMSRQRLFWARLYLHSDLSQRYQLTMTNDQMVIKRHPSNLSGREIGEKMRDVTDLCKDKKLLVLSRFRVLEKSNSHYGGSFPFFSAPLNVSQSGEVENQIYVCDSTTFPSMPAISPTFTIMANSFRIASEAMQS